MTMKYKLESNIPIPVAAQSDIFPFDEMRPGDSFFVPNADIAGNRRKLNYATQYSTKVRGHKYAIRAEGDGFRVWRVG